MQILYLTARPSVLFETLEHVRHFAPFVDEVVVVAPESLTARFEEATGVDLVLTDEALTGRTSEQLAGLDHQSRNQLLRSAAVSHDSIGPTFLMSDDDSRPLVPIDGTTFFDGDRYRRRWFYSLSAWRKSLTPFDEGQLNTWVILRQMGFPEPLSYASHMPQMIDKALYGEVSDRIAPYTDRYALDEWSTYFNIAPSIEPQRFAEPEPFLTLGWPRYPGEWLHQVSPPRYVFENFHEELYDEGGLYGGLRTGCDAATIDATNLDKIVRWHRLDIDVRDLAFPDDIEQPWTSPSARRKLAFKGLKAARGAYRYVALEDRARIAELEGRIQRLESGQGGSAGRA